MGIIGPIFSMFHFSINLLFHTSSVGEEEAETGVYLGVLVCVWGSFNKKRFLERFGDHFGSFSHNHIVFHSLFPYKSVSRV